VGGKCSNLYVNVHIAFVLKSHKAHRDSVELPSAGEFYGGAARMHSGTAENFEAVFNGVYR
jgi:hypothetical protein